MADAVNRFEDDSSIAEPLADATPECNENGIGEKNQPEMATVDAKEWDVNADIIGTVRECHKGDGQYACATSRYILLFVSLSE